MINEAVLLESRSLREGMAERTEVLNKVKALSLLPDGRHVTTAMVATYFDVTVEVIRQIKSRHREELTFNGMRTLQGADLQEFKRDILSLYSESYPQPRSSLTLYPRRAILNIAMLLRDSEVARQVRTYLLDMEYVARTRPTGEVEDEAQNLDDRIDGRITHILGKTVVPMFNALIETAGEHGKELISLREDVQKIERRLCDHQRRLRHLEHAQGPRPYTGIMASIDAMNWREFEHHVAVLLRRDGCTDVVVHGGPGDRGVDVTALTADGRRVVVQCKTFAPYRPVWSGELQKFLGASFVQHKADVALFVATTAFTPDARAIAETYGITVVDRTQLEKWSAGVPLPILQ
ncbi:restriction endonuclease [Streptomyces sp. NPDC059909]|uniref:restriction endonuclease n=1 Tax=Streptomyces sp. NPDC059909 TaxID=3346998 RepID=UPI00365E2A4F